MSQLTHCVVCSGPVVADDAVKVLLVNLVNLDPGASIPGGLGEQSPTFLKVGGLKDWLFQLICGAWIVRRI